MNIILFDDATWQSLLPLTCTRPVGEIRIGILTIKEKWERYTGLSVSHLTEPYLREKFPMAISDDNLFVNSSVLPNPSLVSEILKLQPSEGVLNNDILIALRLGKKAASLIQASGQLSAERLAVLETPFIKINHHWDIFSMNDKALKEDYSMITKNRKSAPIPLSNKTVNPENIFLEEGVKMECAILNASGGNIYIGKDAEVMEGAMIRGPFSLGEHSQVKMGSTIYGATSIGPHCKVGGEISNSVILGYSNKAHDGFLGNSVLGEWCNLGAGTNNSNLKNNYSIVKAWSFMEEEFVSTGLQFCGLIMGDHSKCSINTMFNTGTVVGVSANIFGNGFPQKFVPSFSWGGSERVITYRLEEALEVAQRVYERRGLKLERNDLDIMKYLFEQSTKFRSW